MLEMDTTSLTIAVIIGLLGVLLYLTRSGTKAGRQSKAGHPTIPGLTSSDPILGNLGDLSQAGGLSEFLASLHKDKGAIASFWWGKELVVSLASPGLFLQHSKAFDRPVLLFEMLVPLLTKPSIQFTNGEDGRHRHATYSSCFKDMSQFYPIFHEVAEGAVTRWLAKPEEPFPLRKEMLAIAIQSISRCCYGELFEDIEEVYALARHHDICWKEGERMLDGDSFTPGSARQQQFDESQRHMFDILKRAMALRRQQPPTTPRPLLIDVIMDLNQKEEVQLADAVTFLIGGYHNTAGVLLWTLYYLAKDSSVQEKLYSEIRDVLGDQQITSTNINKLVYTKQVLDESMRASSYPSMAARVENKEIVLDGHVIAPNTPVIHALSAVLRDETLWPDHTRFDPDRFSPEKRKSMPPHAFEPFGFGTRKCPGYRFSVAEMTIVLATVLSHAKLSLVEGQTVVPKSGFTTIPKDELWMTVEKR